jgi:hypothetical protein
MVSDLSGIGTGYAQGLGYAASSRPSQAGSLAAPQTERQEATLALATLDKGTGVLPRLLEDKSDAAASARNVRAARQALDQADALLGRMADLVGAVKNYPPFPPGNEERQQYLNSIDGLRKQLQALVVPPVADRVEPVFYPRESKFPELDANVPSDAAVLAFGEAVAALRDQVKTARAVLQAQATQMADAGMAGLPRPPAETQVPALSAQTAVQLGQTAYPISGGGMLAQLGG